MPSFELKDTLEGIENECEARRTEYARSHRRRQISEECNGMLARRTCEDPSERSESSVDERSVKGCGAGVMGRRPTRCKLDAVGRRLDDPDSTSIRNVDQWPRRSGLRSVFSNVQPIRT